MVGAVSIWRGIWLMWDALTGLILASSNIFFHGLVSFIAGIAILFLLHRFSSLIHLEVADNSTWPVRHVSSSDSEIVDPNEGSQHVTNDQMHDILDLEEGKHSDSLDAASTLVESAEGIDDSTSNGTYHRSALERDDRISIT
jgi:hypothetical protein